MKIECNSLYSIGDLVKEKKIRFVNKNKIICPLCNGKHKVINQNYFVDEMGEDYDDKFLVCNYCNKEGFIETNPVQEEYIDDEIYCIDAVHIITKSNGNVFSYSLKSTPQLNHRTSGYCSCNGKEEDLVRVDRHGEIIK